jgi:hypothetical protein
MSALDTQYDLQNRCGGAPLVFNMLGQAVCGNISNLASGYYLYSDAAIEVMNAAGTNMCPEGMRPGIMRIKGLPASEFTEAGSISTCGGIITQEDVPDMIIVDWSYRALTDGVLLVCLVLLLAGITIKLVK